MIIDIIKTKMSFAIQSYNLQYISRKSTLLYEYKDSIIT